MAIPSGRFPFEPGRLRTAKKNAGVSLRRLQNTPPVLEGKPLGQQQSLFAPQAPQECKAKVGGGTQWPGTEQRGGSSSGVRITGHGIFGIYGTPFIEPDRFWHVGWSRC